MTTSKVKKKKPHLSVAAKNAAQKARWERAAEVEQRKLSDWSRLALDARADQVLGARS